MCNQVRGFHRGARKFIAKTQMTFPNCADINLFAFIYTYFQAKLNSRSSDIRRTSQYMCPTQTQSHRTFCQTVLSPIF